MDTIQNQSRLTNHGNFSAVVADSLDLVSTSAEELVLRQIKEISKSINGSLLLSWSPADFQNLFDSSSVTKTVKYFATGVANLIKLQAISSPIPNWTHIYGSDIVTALNETLHQFPKGMKNPMTASDLSPELSCRILYQIDPLLDNNPERILETLAQCMTKHPDLFAYIGGIFQASSMICTRIQQNSSWFKYSYMARSN